MCLDAIWGVFCGLVLIGAVIGLMWLMGGFASEGCGEGPCSCEECDRYHGNVVVERARGIEPIDEP